MSQKFWLLLSLWLADLHEAMYINQPLHLLTDPILRISVQYFSPGRTLVFSLAFNHENLSHTSAETLTDIANNVIKSLNLIGRWPVVVCRPTGNVTKLDPYTWDSSNKDKHFSYILVASCHDGDHFRQTVMQLKTSGAWNSRGRFLVVVSHCVSQDVKKELKILFECLWSFKVFNVIILYPSTARTVEIYTWFPLYLLSTRCGLLLDIVHLDTWVREQDNGFFLRNVTLYAEKIPRDLHGCVIRVSAIKFHPYVICDENDAVDGGVDVEVLRTVAEKLNASLAFRIPPGEERKGQHLPNGTWTGLKGDLIYDKADIIIGYLLHNFEDHVIFDDTRSYHSDRFTWVVARAKPYPRWLGMGRVFTSSAWLTVLISVVIVGLLMKFLSKSKYYSESNSKWDTAKCVLTVWAAFLGAGVPEMSRLNTMRIMFLSWVMFSFAMNTVFQASFTSYEVDPGLQHQIDDVEELLQTPIIYAFSSPLDRFFTEDALKRLTPRIRCDPTKCIEYIATVYNATTFTSRSLLGYHREELLKMENRHEVHPFREDSFQLNAVMLMQKGSPLLLYVNEIIARIFEAGLSNYWIEAIMEERRVKAGNLALRSLEETYVKLSTSHLQGAFIFLFIGTGFSFIAFVAELLFQMLLSKIRIHIYE
jgi:hypothetical protein